MSADEPLVPDGPGRWLIVVRRDQPALYGYLREGLSGDGQVEIILDRRGAAAGLGDAPPDGALSEELPPVERRGSGSAKDRDRWRTFGYRLAGPRTDRAWDARGPEE